jgi:MFS-type transporter involved in bile tolerance (Atg22 family)
MAIKIVPADRVGEVFGLFNLVGYLSAIVGSLFWGGMLLALSDMGEWGYRITLISLSLFILLGFIFLLRVPAIPRRDKRSLL